jgi:hypothetical protein
VALIIHTSSGRRDTSSVGESPSTSKILRIFPADRGIADRLLRISLKQTIMVDLMEKYESNGHFFFGPDEELDRVCNAPKKGAGVFYCI